MSDTPKTINKRLLLNFAGAISILERAHAAKKSPSLVVGSDKMFELMLVDMNKALADGLKECSQ